MRFIIHEQPTETLLAAGAYRYEQDGRPTGAVESWRLTRVADGYEALRVDLDARDAPSGHTYLYHYVRQTNGRPERLTYRFWGQAAPLGKLNVEGTLIFSETDAVGTHGLNGQTTEISLTLPAGYTVWFPSVAGLGLAAGAPGRNPKAGVTLQNAIGGTETLRPRLVAFDTMMLITDTVDVQVAGRTLPAVPVQITWEAQRRIVVRDTRGWPLTMSCIDAAYQLTLTAAATRLIRYQE